MITGKLGKGVNEGLSAITPALDFLEIIAAIFGGLGENCIAALAIPEGLYLLL